MKDTDTKLPSTVLFILGCLDLLRGFLHTFLVPWAAATFAKLDLSTAKSDQLWLLGIFGVSNFLTGFIFILVSKKARELSPYVLIIIPLTYGLGLMGLKLNGITPNAAFEGKYFMYLYFLVCLGTAGFYFYRKYTHKTKKA
jgi:hypothetical protein